MYYKNSLIKMLGVSLCVLALNTQAATTEVTFTANISMKDDSMGVLSDLNIGGN